MPVYRGEIVTTTLFEFEAHSNDHALGTIAYIADHMPTVAAISHAQVNPDTVDHAVTSQRHRKLKKVWAFTSDWDTETRRRSFKPIADHPVDIQDACMAHGFVISLDEADADSLQHAIDKIELEYERRDDMYVGGRPK